MFIYVEEIFFNLVVFYNLVGKELHDNHFENHYHKVSLYHRRQKSKEQGLIQQIDNSLVSQFDQEKPDEAQFSKMN